MDLLAAVFDGVSSWLVGRLSPSALRVLAALFVALGVAATAVFLIGLILVLR